MRLRRSDRRHLREAQTRDWLRGVVRSGLFDDERVERELREVIAADLPHLDPAVAPTWIAEAIAEWKADAATWPTVSEHERLCAVFDALEREGIPVLQGCEDHWSAKAAVEQLAPQASGLLWFTPMDVWHAVDEPMLEVNVWDRGGANQFAGAPLVERAIEACALEGFEAHFDEGRLEIAARWQRRP